MVGLERLRNRTLRALSRVVLCAPLMMFALPASGGILDRLFCNFPYPWSASEVDWYPENNILGWVYRIENAGPEDVFAAAIFELERRGYTICREQRPAGSSTQGDDVCAGCGPRTSLEKGIISAEQKGLALSEDVTGDVVSSPDRPAKVTAWSFTVYVYLIGEDEATLVHIESWIGGRTARPEIDGDLSLAEPPSILERERLLRGDIHGRFPLDLESAVQSGAGKG